MIFLNLLLIVTYPVRWVWRRVIRRDVRDNAGLFDELVAANVGAEHPVAEGVA